MSHILNTPNFTDEMKKDYKILIPDMLPIHFAMLQKLFRNFGYNCEVLKNEGKSVVDTGLMYVHNDTCYPALMVIGQMIDALNSGKYDLNKTALMITQTGGGCRASNYIKLLKKALHKAGYGHIPVLSLNFAGLDKDSSMKFTPEMLVSAALIITCGDMITLVSNQTRPYEINKGDTDKLINEWIEKINAMIDDGVKFSTVKGIFKRIAKSFSEIPMDRTRKTVKVGVVGEIYVKYSSVANNRLEEFLASEGCEVMVPGLLGFCYYCIVNWVEDYNNYGGKYSTHLIFKFAETLVAKCEDMMCNAVKEYDCFTAPTSLPEIKRLAQEIIGLGCKMGEGWLLVGEMMGLIEDGYENIVCAQPFGCLPNHIVGKGVIRQIRNKYSDANIVPIDYDPGATKVNQENRIKLMLSIAREKL